MGLLQDYLPTPSSWLIEFWALIVKSNLPDILQAIAWSLLIIGIIWSGIRIATLGSSEITGLVFRYMFAGFLVLSGPTLSKDIRNDWIQAQKWGWEKFAKPASEKAAEKLGTMGVKGAVAIVEVGAMVATGGAAKAAFKGTSAAARTTFKTVVKQEAKLAAEGVSNAGQAMLFLATPIVTAYYVVVILSGFGLLVASIMLPIAGAALVFPSGSDWSIRWLKGVLTSLLTVALVPLIFATAMTVGFIGPADKFIEQINSVDKVMSENWDAAGKAWNSGDYGQAGLRAIGQIGATVTSPFLTAIAFIWALLMMVITIGAALAISNGAVNQIAQYVGGVMGSGAGSGAGAALLSFAIAKGISGVKSDMKAASRDAKMNVKAEQNYQRSRQDSASDSLNAQKQRETSATATANQKEAPAKLAQAMDESPTNEKRAAGELRNTASGAPTQVSGNNVREAPASNGYDSGNSSLNSTKPMTAPGGLGKSKDRSGEF